MAIEGAFKVYCAVRADFLALAAKDALVKDESDLATRDKFNCLGWAKAHAEPTSGALIRVKDMSPTVAFGHIDCVLGCTLSEKILQSFEQHFLTASIIPSNIASGLGGHPAT